MIKLSYFVSKYFYIDSYTRVRYGYAFAYLGTVYTLQRKNFFWRDVAWTYAITHDVCSLAKIIKYLKWSEQDKKRLEWTKALLNAT